MIKRFMPAILTLAAMFLDTAVIPVFYHGALTFPVTLPVVFCISVLRGRLLGLLYGMIGGLLTDITAGTLGVMTFYYMTAGFLMGLIVDEQQAPLDAHWKTLARRFGIGWALALLGEAAFLAHRYFVTNLFYPYYLRGVLIRSLLTGAATFMLFPLIARLIGAPRRVSGYVGRTQPGGRF